MKKVSLLSVALFTALTSYAQASSTAPSDAPQSEKKPLTKTIMAASASVKAETSTDMQMTAHTALEVTSLASEATLNGLAYADATNPDQEKPKGKKGKGSEQEKQEVKEVAPSKRQEKPEKVEATAEVSAARSAARPGRGATRAVKSTTSSATKSVGNAVKAVKPIKVGGKVGVGSIIKVGKN